MNNLTVKKISKFAMATTAAAFFASAAAPVAFAGDAKVSASVKCMGINSCKGTSKCATATSACAGQNACKGHGWLLTATADECTKQGGTVIK